MYRLLVLFALALVIGLQTGCGRSKPAVDPRVVVRTEVAEPDSKDREAVIPAKPVVNPVQQPTETGDDHSNVDKLIATVVRTTDRERYEAALVEAIGLLADKKYTQALVSLETAASIQDSETVRQQIALVRAMADQQSAAEKAVGNIQSVLTQGKAEDAAKLGTAALQLFGGSDAAPALAQLKQEADAVAMLAGDDKDTRRDGLMRLAQAAVADGNLRVAAIAYEQVLQLADDPETRKKYDDLRSALDRYDDQRTRAAMLRRNPSLLEEAISALQQAQKAWDTQQVRLELDECSFALQKRRDRLTVADFDIRGDVGVAQAGRLVADELLPAFKSRFDLVERGAFNQLVNELKLEAGSLGDHSEARQELGRLARVRYLVVGSITPLDGGVNASARLVEVPTGLVVQTARLSAPTMSMLVKRLPQLAQMLMMSDEQRSALEQALAEKAAADAGPIELAALPPPPPAPPVDVNAAPPPTLPVIAYSARPVALGGLTVEAFASLPPVVIDAPPAPPVEVILTREDPRRRRLVQLAVFLGDNLFRRGRWQEAHRHYALALNYGDDSADVQVRVDRCRPYLAPVVAPSAPVVRPRMIVFNFVLNTPPGLVPISLGDLAADQLGAYFGATHDIVDRGEVCWYMGRLGITLRDLVTDPAARVCLAQAMNVRYFVYGAIVQTSSFDVSTHLIDAQTGQRTGTGTIHVQDQQELKLRIHELAHQMARPGEQARLADKGRAAEKALADIRAQQKAGNQAEAVQSARLAVKNDPDSIALKVMLLQLDTQAHQSDLEAERKRESARSQAEREAARLKQEELVKQTETARVKAENEAKSRTEAARREAEARKERVAGLFQDRGKRAMQRQAYAQAVEAFRDAVALKPTDSGFRELAQAQAKLDEQKRKDAADAVQAREMAARRARLAALARIDAENARLADEEASRRKAQEARDKIEYARLMDQSRTSLSRGDYDKALAAAQAARALKPGLEVDVLLVQIRQKRDLAEAARKGEQAKKDLEDRIAREKAVQEKADLQAKKNEEAYSLALKAAQTAIIDKKYDDAVLQYQAALKIFRTDAALTGLKKANDLRALARAQAESARQAKSEQENRAIQLNKLLADGAKALAAKDFDGAIRAYSDAARLEPGNIDALAGKSKAAQARAEYLIINRDKVEQNSEQVRDLVSKARAAINEKKYADAELYLGAAKKLSPNDLSVAAATKDLETARKPSPADLAKMKQRQEDYKLAMDAGRAAAKKQNYAGAVNAYKQALLLMPGDKDATELLGIAQRLADEATKKNTLFTQAMTAAKAGLSAKKYDDAIAAANQALKVRPGNSEAQAILQQAQAGKAAAQPPSDAKKKEDFNRLMSQAKAAMTAKKYPDAIAAYADALKLYPSDIEAKRGQTDATNARNTSYNNSMAEGKRAAQAKKFPDAIKAYQDALKMKPGDPDATAALSRAKQNKP